MNKIVNCNICGGPVSVKYQISFESLVGMADEYTQDICICDKCGFIFTGNPFSSEQLADRYKNFSKFEFDSDDYILDEAEDYKIRCKRQKQFIDRVIGLDNIDSILEIGASTGYNLSLYENCECMGVEPSENNCKNAKLNYGIDMYCGMVEEFFSDKNIKGYDLIFMSHVFEHIVNPCDFMKKCSEFNNRYVFIEVPTFDYKFVEEPFGMFAEEHVNMFTLESMQNLMEVCGYRLVNVDMIMGLEQFLPSGWPAISTIWEKHEKPIKKHKSVCKSEVILDYYLKESEAEFERVKMIIDGIPDDKRLAVWGTGHHGSMLLVNTSLGRKNIVRVYDSDRRKKGELFHNVKIEPFNEQDIINGEIDYVLLATYTAQHALERIIAPYSDMVKVIKLYDI